MLTDVDLEKVRSGLEGAEAPVELIFRPADGDAPLASALHETARRIEQASRGMVKLGRDDGALLVARPALTVSCRSRANLHYLAVPEGLETPPFVEALIGMAQAESAPSPEWASDLRTVTEPAELLVFMASTCPHCPQAVRNATRIALATPRVTTSIVDALAYSDLAERFKAQSVPLVVLDRGLSRTGVVPASEIAGLVLSRGTDEHEVAVFASLIEHGHLGEAASRIQSGSALAAFASVWRDSTTSSRMGLLLVVAEVLDAGSKALDRAVPQLVEILGSDDVSLRGDTADLLGQIGHPSAVDGLRALLDDANPDVVEAAEDALEAIGENTDQEPK